MENISYALKAARSLISGFTGVLQWNSYTGWEDLEDGEIYEDPYYVCPLFENGKHLPLPFFWEENGFKKSEYFLQNLVLFFLQFTRGYREAREYCEEYVLAWKEWQGPEQR